MTELIKVTEQNGEQLVSARELHEFLEIKSKFADWIKNRIEKYGFEEKQDYITFSKNLESGGREIDYILKLDMAKELSMVEGNEKGSQARKYFIACEKRLKEIATPKLPQTYKEALLELIRVEEEKEQLLIANSKLEEKTKTQHKLIDTMTETYDGTYIRLVCTDYVNKVARESGRHQADLYSDLYKLTGHSTHALACGV